MGIKVTNTGSKTIGLGGQPIHPNDTATLPEGFGLEHPTVDFFIRRGWLAKVTDGGIVVPHTVKGEGLPKADGDESKPSVEGEAKNTVDEKIEALAKMDHDGLRAEATRLGINFASNAGPDLLRQRITDRYREESGVPAGSARGVEQ